MRGRGVSKDDLGTGQIRGSSESGNMLVLGMGLSAVVMALVLLAASVSAVYLDAKRLTALTDRALWDATGGACRIRDPHALGDPSQPLVDPVCVEGEFRRRLVSEFSSDSQGGLSGLEVRSVSSDGQVISVSVHAQSQPPFLPWAVIPSEGIAVDVVSSSRGFAQF